MSKSKINIKKTEPPFPKNASVETKKTQKILFYIGVLFSIIPLMVYYSVAYQFTFDFPWNDDIDLIGNFNTFSSLDFWNKLIFFFAQHNEHRIAFSKVFFYFIWKLEGNLDFKTIAFTGNLCLIPLFYILSLEIFKVSKNIVYVSIFSFLLFQFQFWENTIWSIAAVTNIAVYFFAILSIYFLIQEKENRWFLSIPCTLFATYTLGSGLLIFIVGIIINIFHHKDYKKTLIWIVFSAISIGIYFIGYVKPPHHPSMSDALFSNPIQTIQHFLNLLGGATETYFGRGYIMYFGVFYLFTLLFSTLKRLYIVNPLLYYFQIFLYLTAAIVSLGRSGFGIDQALSSRYMILCILIGSLSIISILILLKDTKQKNVYLSFLVLISVASWVKSYVASKPTFDIFLFELKFAKAAYSEKYSGNFIKYFTNPDKAIPVLDSANQAGVYKVNSYTFLDMKSQIQDVEIPSTYNTDQFVNQFKVEDFNKVFMIKYGIALVQNKNSFDSKIFVVVRGKDYVKVYDTYYQYFGQVSKYFNVKNDKYTNCGFTWILDKKDLDKGNYSLEILILNKNKKYLSKTNEVISI